jgi:acetyl esterase
MSVQQMRQARSFASPNRAPFTWIVGRVPRGVDISEATFRACDGEELSLRVYRPSRGAGLPVIVYFHGGGWVLGSVRGYDPLCGYLADAVGAVVVNVDYRLAPEHPAPHGVHDCVDAVRWIGSNGSVLRADVGRLAVSGDSAGGNLAAVAARVIRDEGGPAIGCQALIYPGTDATMSHPSIAEHADAPMLTRAEIVEYLYCYLDGTGLDPKDPLVSPFWVDDLSGLPPALVQTADLDPLRDEGLGYASKLADAGVAVRATNYLGAPHGFMSFPGVTVCAPQARLELVTELRRHLV